MEEGPLAWALQKLANAVGWIAVPFTALEGRLDEAAFRSAKRHERRT